MERYTSFYNEAFTLDYFRIPKTLILSPDYTAICRITKSGYSMDWWNKYVGVVFECVMFFHRMQFPWHFYYLYEVYPLMRKGENNIAIGKPIRAECVYIEGWETMPGILSGPSFDAQL